MLGLGVRGLGVRVRLVYVLGVRVRESVFLPSTSSRKDMCM